MHVNVVSMISYNSFMYLLTTNSLYRSMKKRTLYSDPQYHSLAPSNGGRGQLSRKPHSPVDTPILPMTVLDSDPLPRAVAT